MSDKVWRTRSRSARPAPDSRAVALGALQGVREGKNLPEALAAAGLADLPPRDRAFARRLAQYALRHGRRLQWEVAQFLSKPLTPGRVSDLLWLGNAQIDMADVADHAAVHATVELAPRPMRGLVNAVLRRRLREGAPEGASAAVAASLPDWLYRAIVRDWGGQAPALMQALNEEPPLCLRINRQRAGRDAYLADLVAQGLDAAPLGEDGIVLGQSVAVSELPGYDQGQVSVQGASAQLAASLLDIRPGQSLLDACAAPGGKTAHLLERCPELRLTALDADPVRLARVSENLDRLGLQARLFAGDAAAPGPWQGEYDHILLDVPCSGTGVMARHPDIKWLRRESDIPALRAQQLALLEAAWAQLKPGGTLLYCTCSILSAENADLIEEFLVRTPAARVLGFTLPTGQAAGPGWRIAPDGPWEGFFYARLIRTGS